MLSLATPSQAFCRLTTNSINYDPEAAVCDPDPTAIPLHWASNHLTFAMQKDASAQVDLALATSAAETAFATWEAIDCSQCASASHTGSPSVQVDRMAPTSDNCLGFHADWVNSNTIMFRDSSWVDCDGTPQPNADSIIALTVHTYAVNSGQIFDADIEINTANNKVTIGSSDAAFDLQSILTHETGHFLGLAHTQTVNNTSTMFYQYVAGSTNMRTPKPDDICGMCEIYPPGAAISDSQLGFFCSFRGSPGGAFFASFFAVFGAFAWRRRRHRLGRRQA